MEPNKSRTLFGIIIGLLVIIILILVLKPKPLVVPGDTSVPEKSGGTSVDTSGNGSVSTTLPQYIGGQEGWPPVIQNSSAAYSCFPAGSNEISNTAERVINHRTYCVTTSIEGAAGSRFGAYTYITANGSGTKTTNFTLRWPSCGGYGGPGDAEYDACQSAQTNFFGDLDTIINSLM